MNAMFGLALAVAVVMRRVYHEKKSILAGCSLRLIFAEFFEKFLFICRPRRFAAGGFDDPFIVNDFDVAQGNSGTLGDVLADGVRYRLLLQRGS
jgi:hypothetical protein